MLLLRVFWLRGFWSFDLDRSCRTAGGFTPEFPRNATAILSAESPSGRSGDIKRNTGLEYGVRNWEKLAVV